MNQAVMGHGSVNPLCLLEQKVTWATQPRHYQRAFFYLRRILRSSGTWVLTGVILGRDSPFQKQSADESRNGKITLGFFFFCVCELLEVIYVGINEIIWPN